MIVCICHRVTEKQIADLLPATVEDVMMKTNAAMCCGACFTTLQKIVEPVSDNRSSRVIYHLTTPV